MATEQVGAQFRQLFIPGTWYDTASGKKSEQQRKKNVFWLNSDRRPSSNTYRLLYSQHTIVHHRTVCASEKLFIIPRRAETVRKGTFPGERL